MAHSNFNKGTSSWGKYGHRVEPNQDHQNKNHVALWVAILVSAVSSISVTSCTVYVPANAGRAGVYNPPPPVYASRPNTNTLRITCGPIGINRQIITAPYRNPHDGVWSCSSVDYYPLPVPTGCPRPGVYAWDIENNRYRGVGCG